MTGDVQVTTRKATGETVVLTYRGSQFRGKKLGCDLVMKGGITSGVVYPLAVAELAKQYRFHGIGGTSAGAIAAALTAAAEYARGRGGFEKLVTIPGDLAGGLLKKFQPDPALRPIFGILLAALSKSGSKLLRMLGAALAGYWLVTLIAVAIGAMIGITGYAYSGWWGASTGFAAGILLLAILLSWRLYHAVTVDLPAANFGICSGQTQAGSTDLAFTDWLADMLDTVAARGDATNIDHPLTFGDLESGPHQVQLRMITSDIAMGRPYELPFRDNLHFFSESEFTRLFPPRVMTYLTRIGTLLPADSQNEAGDLRYLPSGKDLPVVVAVRLSLSFPGLIQAVPLYKRDYLLTREEDQRRPVKCHFSDGGLTSNFPIHLFDRLWPNRPTFAINLDEFNPKADDEQRRVWMHTLAGSGQIVPIVPVEGIGGFFWALLNTAKGWQDSLQSILPGYRERIVHIALKDSEGGLNLDMDKETIERLLGFGAQAGAHIIQYFDLSQHRWRRHLTAVARVEETLAAMYESHTAPCGGPDDFTTFLAGYNPAAGSYKLKGKSLAELRLKTADLVTLAGTWDPRLVLRRLTQIPRPESAMRITPKP
jgi:predicted acylesterase/phospholipase RssA